MFRTAIVTGALVMVVIAVQADVGIGTQVITTGTKIEVLEPGPDLQAIIDGITDEGPSKPYLIELGPGEYTILPNPSTSKGLVMAPHISIMGSGQGVTILKGAFSSDVQDETSAIVSGATNAALTDLSVENDGSGGNYSTAIYNDNASPRIERVTAKVSVGTNIAGVINTSFSFPTMTQVTVRVFSGFNNYGVFNSFSSGPIMTEVTVDVLTGTNSWGVFNDASAPTMTQVTVKVCGGTGVAVQNFSTASAPRIESSYLEGCTFGVNLAGSTATRITNSQIIGGAVGDDTGTTNCRDNYDENLDVVTC